MAKKKAPALTPHQERRRERRAERIAAREAAPPPPAPLPDLEVADKLSDSEKGIYTGGTELSDKAIDMASANLGSTQLGTAFDPTLTGRTTGTDLLGDRQRIEEEVFGRLTRDLDTRYKQTKEETAQMLANKGIPYSADPNSRYQQELMAVDKRFDLERTDARQRAAEIGGGEYSRNFGIQEQLRANEFSEQSGTRNQQIGEVGSLANTGPGLQNFFNMAGIQNADDQLALQEFIAKLQAKTSKNVAKINNQQSGGGGLTPDQQAAKDEAAAGF